MINAKGETIYTSSEIAHELGISSATVNAIARRVFGDIRIPHWTLNDVKLICKYIQSISVEQEAKRLQALHETIVEIMGETTLDDIETKKRVDKDIYLKKEERE